VEVHLPASAKTRPSVTVHTLSESLAAAPHSALIGLTNLPGRMDDDPRTVVTRFGDIASVEVPLRFRHERLRAYPRRKTQ
jgi:hypothetical protein